MLSSRARNTLPTSQHPVSNNPNPHAPGHLPLGEILGGRWMKSFIHRFISFSFVLTPLHTASTNDWRWIAGRTPIISVDRVWPGGVPEECRRNSTELKLTRLPSLRLRYVVLGADHQPFYPLLPSCLVYKELYCMLFESNDSVPAESLEGSNNLASYQGEPIPVSGCHVAPRRHLTPLNNLESGEMLCWDSGTGLGTFVRRAVGTIATGDNASRFLPVGFAFSHSAPGVLHSPSQILNISLLYLSIPFVPLVRLPSSTFRITPVARPLGSHNSNVVYRHTQGVEWNNQTCYTLAKTLAFFFVSLLVKAPSVLFLRASLTQP